MPVDRSPGHRKTKGTSTNTLAEGDRDVPVGPDVRSWPPDRSILTQVRGGSLVVEMHGELISFEPCGSGQHDIGLRRGASSKQVDRDQKIEFLKGLYGCFSVRECV